MKIYTNPSCHYCKKVKDALIENEVDFEEVITSENFDEWNDLLRITGLAVTPTIKFQEEIWLPNRDFRTAKENREWGSKLRLSQVTLERLKQERE